MSIYGKETDFIRKPFSTTKALGERRACGLRGSTSGPAATMSIRAAEQLDINGIVVAARASAMIAGLRLLASYAPILLLQLFVARSPQLREQIIHFAAQTGDLVAQLVDFLP